MSDHSDQSCRAKGYDVATWGQVEFQVSNQLTAKDAKEGREASLTGRPRVLCVPGLTAFH